MAKRQSLQEMCQARYSNTEVAAAVHDDAVKLGTADKIISGELVLPGEVDAHHWHRRMTHQEEVTEERYKDLQRIAELEKAVDALTKSTAVPQKDYLDRLAKLESQYAKK